MLAAEEGREIAGVAEGGLLSFIGMRGEIIGGEMARGGRGEMAGGHVAERGGVGMDEAEFVKIA